MDIISFAAGFFVALVLVFVVFILFRLFLPWRRAFFCGAKVSLATIIGMVFRGHPPTLLVNALVELIHSGEEIGMAEVETCYAANQHMVRDSHSLAELVRKERRKSAKP